MHVDYTFQFIARFAARMLTGDGAKPAGAGIPRPLPNARSPAPECLADPMEHLDRHRVHQGESSHIKVNQGCNFSGAKTPVVCSTLWKPERCDPVSQSLSHPDPTFPPTSVYSENPTRSHRIPLANFPASAESSTPGRRKGSTLPRSNCVFWGGDFRGGLGTARVYEVMVVGEGGVMVLRRVLRWMRSLRMTAVRATLAGFFCASSRW